MGPLLFFCSILPAEQVILHVDKLPSTVIQPWDSPADHGGHLRFNRPRINGGLPAGDFLLAVRSIYRDKVAYLHLFQIGYIRHHHIHTDISDRRHPLAADEQNPLIGVFSAVAVGIPTGNYRDPCLARRDKIRGITDALPGLHGTQHRHAGFELEHRLERRIPPLNRSGADPL